MGGAVPALAAGLMHLLGNHELARQKSIEDILGHLRSRMFGCSDALPLVACGATMRLPPCRHNAIAL